MTTVIAFNSGAYGTYLNWALDSLLNDQNLTSPLTVNSNSHGYTRNHLNNIQGWQKFLANKKTAPVVRLHPKTQNTESISNNLNSILEHADYLIYLYPSRDHVLLAVNNYYEKVWTNWWDNQYQSVEELNSIYQNWPVAHGTPIEKIPRWILREYLSLYLMPSWYDQVEWYHPEHWNHSRSILITTKDLLYRFEQTIRQIQDFCNFTFTKSILSLLPFHNQMISAQKNLTQDQLCVHIVNSVSNNTYLDWSNQRLTLPSEAWIQWQLRNLGRELACNGLDTFPTNSVQLQSLL